MVSRLHISNLLRKLGLLRVTDAIRFQFYKLKKQRKNKSFKKRHAEFILPPPYFIYETYQLDYKLYYHDGLVTAGEIIDSIKKYKQPYSGFAILDWGCGPGRITRHLPALLPAGSAVFGTDYNTTYIEWCKENIPGINWNVNNIFPPLKYEGESLDAIIGLSVFTHLAESSHAKWIDELYRITKKEGIIYMTTQGNAFVKKLTPPEIKAFEKGDLVVRENKREGHRLYSTFHPVSYMRRLVLTRFEICELMEGSNLQGSEPSQDIWILKKK